MGNIKVMNFFQRSCHERALTRHDETGACVILAYVESL